MKKLLTLIALCGALTAGAQTPTAADTASGYRFTDLKVLRTTPVKDQSRSGTCWCYSTMTFLESEILKAGGPEMHLSEMWIVRHSFMDKAEKYIRMHGTINFAEGGASRDVTEGIKAHGIVPQTIRKSVRKVLEISHSAEEEKTTARRKLTDAEREATIRRLEKEMKEASKMLEFEYAALLRDQIIELRGQK